MNRRAAGRKPEVAADASEASRALRRRAGTHLGKRKKGAVPQRTDAGSARLFHELEVHQIELELQNAELRDARDEVEAALERYTDLYDFAPVGYFSVDEKGVILDVNLAGADMVGVERSKLVRRKLLQFVAPPSQETFQAFLGRVIELPGKQVCEVSLRREDGSVLWADLQAASAETMRGSRRWCRVAVSDVTALKRADEAQLRAEALAVTNRELNLEIARRHKVELALKASDQVQARLLEQSRRLQDQLRQLSRGILHAQEEERKRVSRELHDVVAQSAIGIKLHLVMLGQEAAGKSVLRKERIEKSRKLLADLVDSVHRFCRELRPTMLDDLGLVPALESFTRDFSQRTGVGVRFAPDAAAERLSNAKRTVLYRVAQEALTNVAKHAHATQVDVRIQAVPGSVCLEVADDGKAFDVERAMSAQRQHRLGLLGMRERVEMVGGTLSIDSGPGKGTRVRARIPLADEVESAVRGGVRRGGGAARRRRTPTRKRE